MELGRLADGRPFVNVASAGLASAAARRAEPFKSDSARSPTRSAPSARPRSAQPLAVHGPRGRRGGLRRRRLAGDRRRHAARSAAGPSIGAADPRRRRARRRGPARRLAPRASPAAPGALRRGTIAEQRDVGHARGTVIEVDLPPGTEFNVDGEVQDYGMERITVEHRAYELVVG